MYDGEIRYTDDLIGAIFEDLEDRELLKNTYIIITSDHGEGFWEHEFYGHGNSFFNEEIKIPLIIYPPGGRKKEPQKVDVPLSNIDLFPTIITFARSTNPENIAGESLARFLSNSSFSKGNDMLFSESPHSFDIEAMAVIKGGGKYIDTPNKPKMQHLLFNLEEDPEEKDNQSGVQKDLMQKLRGTLRQHKTLNNEKRKSLDLQMRQPDKKTIDGLKSLGYLQ